MSSNKPVLVARTKTKNVQREMRLAEADLHDSNGILASSNGAGALSPKAVQAALAQNVDVEEKLHDAVQELEVVSELLNVAKAENAQHDDQTMAGHRSGEGLESVLEHMAASAKRKERRHLAAPGSLPPPEPT